MKKVSLRDFQLKPSKYLGDLPIVLTKYGNPIATVNTIKKTLTLMGRVAEITKRVSDEKIKEIILDDKPNLENEFHPIPKPKK